MISVKISVLFLVALVGIVISFLPQQNVFEFFSDKLLIKLKPEQTAFPNGCDATNARVREQVNYKFMTV